MEKNIISLVPQSLKCTCRFLQSLDNGKMWLYNILGDDKGIISHLLRFDPVTAGYDLLASNLVFMKRKNPEHIITVKRIEWRKCIDYFSLSIEANSSKLVKKNVYLLPYCVYTNLLVWKSPHSKAKDGQRVEYETT